MREQTEHRSSEPVWLPFLHRSSFLQKRSRKVDVIWVAERAPFFLDPAPPRSAVLTLRRDGHELTWSTDGVDLYRDVLNRDGEPLRISDLAWENFRADELFDHANNHNALVDYPLSVSDPMNEAGVTFRPEFRADIESGDARNTKWEFNRWVEDNRDLGLAKAHEKVEGLSIDGDRLVRTAEEPLIAVRHHPHNTCVVVEVVILPDLSRNRTTMRTLVDAEGFEGDERQTLLRPHLGAVIYFPITEAETARRCAERMVEVVGQGAKLLDVLPEIEIHDPEFTPVANCELAYLRAFDARMTIGENYFGMPDPRTPKPHAQDLSVLMAKRAVKLAANGDERLVPLTIDAIIDDIQTREVDDIYETFGRLLLAKNHARNMTADADIDSMMGPGL